MRALAMTGMETMSMMPCTMSGSLIRETPPWARMSAGTRSRAITATAPASSAILACSGVTTSMMTPPLSISAIPRLTREVPVAGALVGVVACADKTVPLPVISHAGISHAGSRMCESHMQSPHGVHKGFGNTPHVRASGPTHEHRQLVVDLEGLRELGMAGQPEQAHPRFAPHPAHVGHRVVEEPAGQLHPLVRCGHARQHRGADDPVLPQVPQCLLAQGQLESLGQVALDGFTRGLGLGVGAGLE